MNPIKLCNAIRMEFEGVFENKIPLDAFSGRIQDIILALWLSSVESTVSHDYQSIAKHPLPGDKTQWREIQLPP